MFNRILEFFAARKQQQVMVNLIDMFQANRPLADLWDVKRFTEDGYRRNSLIFACVNIKATSFMEPELKAYRKTEDGEQELPAEHMLNVLLAHPNARDSQSTFMRKWSTCLDVAGNVYVLKLRNRDGMPLQLKILRPDCTRPIPDEYGEIIAYEYGVFSGGRYDLVDLETGKEAKGYEPQVIPARDVIHETAYPDPIERYRGLSPIAVLARMGDLDNYAADYLRAFFLNAGIPSGILKVKTKLSRQQADEYREKWKERYSLRAWSETGRAGAFDLAVLDQEADYQEIGSKIRFMDLEQVFGETESRICMSFGVHPIIVACYIGLLRSTLDNYHTARKQLYGDTLKPLWTSTADRMTVDLAAPDFDDRIYLRFDTSEIPELQEDRTAIKKFALNAWDSGLATRNEVREACGWPPDEAEGDVYKTAAMDLFVPATISQQRLRPYTERLALSTSVERHQALPGWKIVRSIAQRSEPSVKKKSSLPSQRLKTG